MGIWVWLLLISTIAVAVMLYIRFTPIDTAYYVQSPKTAPSDGKPHEYRLINENAPEYALPAGELAKMASQYLSEKLGGKRLDDNTNPLFMTYEVRTKVMGYRDYVSVEVDPIDENHSRLNVFSRSHFGTGDMGVNKERVEKMVDFLKTESSK